MVAVPQFLISAMQQEKAFTASPSELATLYKQSRQFLTQYQGSIDDETWFGLLQQHFYLSLLSSHDNDASLMLGRITDRFSEKTGRVALMKSQYIEATEGPQAAIKYLESRPDNDLLSLKRKASFSKFNGNFKEYIDKLLEIADIIPTDSELWAELGEAYFASGQFLQAIHAYQEVILLTPHAYNIFARIAEIYHTLVVRNPNYNFVDKLEYLRLSVQHYLRAVELCPVYVRGWAGVQIVSQKILTLSESSSKLQADDKKNILSWQSLQNVSCYTL